MNATKLYRENEKMIKSMSGKVSRITGIEKDEVEAQGNLIFCECLQRYEENRGQFSKYLSNALHFGLYKYAKHEAGAIDHFEITESNSDISKEIESKLSAVYDYSDIVDTTFVNLSTDSQYICGLVLSADKELPKRKYSSTRVSKRKLTEHLRAEGWKFTRINNAFNEISVSMGAM